MQKSDVLMTRLAVSNQQQLAYRRATATELE